MGLFKIRRSKYSVSTWRTFRMLYRGHQRAMASISLTIGGFGLGYGLLFDRAALFGSLVYPLFFGAAVIFGMWGIRHYK